MSSAAPFEYLGLDIDAARSELRGSWRIGEETFVERIVVPDGDLSLPAAEAAARIWFLLAGVSYLKTRAALVVDLGDEATTSTERSFLAEYLIEGLGEFAWKNGLDLRGLRVEGREGSPAPAPSVGEVGDVLIPFGGGLDSIVTVAELAPPADSAALFVAERPGARFAAIEEAAWVTGLAVVRAERSIDEKVLDSAAHGYLNGHVPVTGIISALAVLAATATGRGSVAMSNERSASSATTKGEFGPVNHQWSKGLAFESGFRSLVQGRIPGFEYFSWLRDRSELSIAEAFARLTDFHDVFRSCNRSFHQEPARRLETWCGTCDKCLFIDLALAPHLPAEDLRRIFDGREPLENPALDAQLEVLVGTGDAIRPFECVGDEAECRSALVLAAARPDRQANERLQRLAREIGEVPVEDESSEGFIPQRFGGGRAPRDRLV